MDIKCWQLFSIVREEGQGRLVLHTEAWTSPLFLPSSAIHTSSVSPGFHMYCLSKLICLNLPLVWPGLSGGTRLISILKQRRTHCIWYVTFEWILQITMPSVGPNKPHAALAAPTSLPLSAPPHIHLQLLSSEARCVNTDTFKLAW